MTVKPRAGSRHQARRHQAGSGARTKHMTTAAAGHTGEKDKDKVEKRRALGRGLESLLPGPRVVRPPVGPTSGADAGARAGMPAVHSTAPQGPASGPQIPHVVRNDHAAPSSTAVAAPPAVPHIPTDAVQGVPFEGPIRAVVEGALEEDPAAALAGVSASNGVSASVGDLSGAEIEAITIHAQAESRVPGNLVVNLAISDIDKNPFQTRYVHDDDALEELAESIKVSGVVQPIVVRPSEEEEGRYILVLGERRLHASKKAGKTTIPALVRRIPLQQAAEMTIVENLQREDLSALEQAEAFRVLSNNFNMTQQQIAERVGLSRVSVANYMRLLKLPREVMQLLAEKRINFAKAKELLKLQGDDRIAEAALYAVKKGLTLEQVEMLVLRMDGLLDPLPDMPGQTTRKSSGARWVDPNVRAAQLDLERMLGVRVRIRDRKGKGKIVIEYHTVDDYERVVEMLRGKK